MCHECGYHRTLTNDPDAEFAIEVEECAVCASMAKWDRIQQAADKKALEALGDKAPPDVSRPDDGRHTVVRLVSAGQSEGSD